MFSIYPVGLLLAVPASHLVFFFCRIPHTATFSVPVVSLKRMNRLWIFLTAQQHAGLEVRQGREQEFGVEST